MPRKRKSEKQKEQDQKGAERLKRFEERNQVPDDPIIKSVDDGDYEERTLSAYQKKAPGDWELIKITYRVKKK